VNRPHEVVATLDLANTTPEALDDAARHYARQGYLILHGVEELVTRPLRHAVADVVGAGEAEFEALVAPSGQRWDFPLDIRQRLSRVTTTPQLAETLTTNLRTILRRLLGPMVHVSSTFHAQFKAADALKHAVDHGGYLEQNRHMELHGAYLLHQDFAGASIPTSPHGITLWAGLNDSPDWTLRLYPGSHRTGLVCHRWLVNDDPRLEQLAAPIEFSARPGTAVLFNAMLIHGSGRSGNQRRVSCDIRMFPLCGFLPTQPYFLDDQPLAALANDDEQDPFLRLPRQEAQLFLGQQPTSRLPEEYGLEYWLGVVRGLLAGDVDAAEAQLEPLVNTALSTGSVADYAARLLSRFPSAEMLAELHARLAEREPASPDLEALAAHVDRLTSSGSATGGVANAPR